MHEDEVKRVREGDRVMAYVHGVDGQVLQGRVQAIDTGAINPRSQLQPGTVVRTLELLGDSMLFASGECHDLIDLGGAEPRFAERCMVYDSRAVETLMVIPI